MALHENNGVAGTLRKSGAERIQEQLHSGKTVVGTTDGLYVSVGCAMDLHLVRSSLHL